MGGREVRSVYFSIGGKIIIDKTKMGFNVFGVKKQTLEMTAKVKKKIHNSPKDCIHNQMKLKQILKCHRTGQQ